MVGERLRLRPRLLKEEEGKPSRIRVSRFRPSETMKIMRWLPRLSEGHRAFGLFSSFLEVGRREHQTQRQEVVVVLLCSWAVDEQEPRLHDESGRPARSQ